MTDRHLSRRAFLDRRLHQRETAAQTPPAAAAPPAAAPQGRGPAVPRVAPRTQLVNTLEYEEQAKRVLSPAVHALIAGGDRSLFDRITLRPRVMIRTTGLDLTATLFGEPHTTPILVGPIAEQQRFHADGELGTARGAAAAKATLVLSSASRATYEAVAAVSGTPPWLQVFATDNAAAAHISRATAAGCKVVCLTVGVADRTAASPTPSSRTSIDWSAVAALIRATKVPVVVKGVSSPESASMAIARGAQGVVVSNYGGLTGRNELPLILTLPAIVDAVAGKVPVLVDGSFRRGTDILKALAFGASGVLIGRPVMWGLAAYGSEGVQGVIEMLQTELARYMAMSGRPDLKSLDRTLVRVHGK